MRDVRHHGKFIPNFSLLCDPLRPLLIEKNSSRLTNVKMIVMELKKIAEPTEKKRK